MGHTKVIDGLRYDTNQATKITHRKRSYKGQFEYCKESLYVTENGNYFLAGEGGPKSPYSTRTPTGMYAGSSGVRTTLSESEALEWCERHDVNPTLIENHFDIEEA